MKYVLWSCLALASACTSPATPPPTETASAPEPAALPAPAAVDEAQAHALAARYFRQQPDSAVYILSKLRVLDAGASWQALVKRTDRVGRMPDNSAINIDKQTGRISAVLGK